MPGFDGTGPMGMGPMTGGGFGRCAADAAPAGGNALRGIGHGGAPWGGGRGRCFGGRGMGRRMSGREMAGFAGLSAQDEASVLNNRASALESELAAIHERLSSLEQESEKK